MTARLKRFSLKRFSLKSLSIRTRLLVVYIAVLLIGFGGLTLIAGQQISAGARDDYEQRLKSEVALIAQGLAQDVDDYLDKRITDADMQNAFAEYETSINGTLQLIPLTTPRSFDGDEGGRWNFRDEVELETAVRGEISLVERKDDAGEDRLYTASLVTLTGRPQALIQLSVLASNLQHMIMQRWLELGLIFAFVALLGVSAAFWLAHSIIHPLYKLRESALRLSEGDFSHRIDYKNRDEIGEVARAFNEMAIQVESMLEEQRAFASNTSHELRTPLTTIRLRTEAMRYDPTLEPDVAERYVVEIDEEIKRLGNLVEDLTLLSRFDAGRAELGQEQVNMQRFAISLRDQMLPIAEDKQIRLTLIPPDPSLSANASLNHLRVIFRNLLDNAIKYTPPGGEITWKIEAVDGGIRHVISDNGHGIDADSLPHVFERFYRVDKARSRDVPGTGLGLALVKSIVEAYGGSIGVTSAGLDAGTTVSVTLPTHPIQADAKQR